jgi:hypothetical protein
MCIVTAMDKYVETIVRRAGIRQVASRAYEELVRTGLADAGRKEGADGNGAIAGHGGARHAGRGDSCDILIPAGA